MADNVQKNYLEFLDIPNGNGGTDRWYVKDTEAATLIPVDISTLTPSSTFVKNNVLGINGVLYRAKNNTSTFPVTLATQDGAFVVNTINGKICFVVTDPTLNSNCEIWTDASIEYWVDQLNTSLAGKQNTISDLSTIRSGSAAGATAYQKPSGGIPKTDLASAVQTSLGKADTSLQTIQKGAVNGLAELDANGRVPSSQLPSFVDDVINGYYNTANGKFYKTKSGSTYTEEITGEEGKIYIDLDTNKTYRWNGSNAFVVISETLALGTTSSTAYRGDYGDSAYQHSQDSGKISTAESLGLYKLSTTAQGHVGSVSAVTKSDITALGIPGQDTTYSDATQSASGLMSASDKTKLDGVASGATANTGTITSVKMNGSTVSSSGEADLGTVITSHQSVTDNNPTLSWSTKSKVATIGSTDIHVTMPANPNTNTTYTFAEGSTNGAFSVTPSGGSAQSVSVHGLGTAAYKGVAADVNTSTNLVQSNHVKAYVDDRAIIPVDENALTPSSTFVKGNVVGINGVLYYCTQDTSNFPVILATQGNAFVYNESEGHKCFVVTNATIQTGWVQWCDASVEYWLSFKQNKLTFDSTPTASSSNPVTSGGIKTAIDSAVSTLNTAISGKQDALTFDSAPTDSSTNPVTSGGVYTALAGKQATLQYDSAPTSSSQKMVKSGDLYNAFAGTIWRYTNTSWTTKTLNPGECAISTNNVSANYSITINDNVTYIHKYAFMVYSESSNKIYITVNMSNPSPTPTTYTKTLTHPSGKASGIYYFEVLCVQGGVYLTDSYRECSQFT